MSSTRHLPFSAKYRGEWEPADFALHDGPHEPYMPSVYQRGMVAFCVCGWHPNNHPGFILGDHLKDMA